MTTRGLNEEDFRHIAHLIIKTLENKDNLEKLNEIKEEVIKLTSRYPLNY